MKDILLDKSGDIFLSLDGDISLVTSPVQTVMIKLRWLFGEWVFAPDKGVPWYETVLVKKPDMESIKKIMIKEMLDVDDVLEVQRMDISLDAQKRMATVQFTFKTSKEVYREEVVMHG